jgi:hypothetical protein
MLAGNVCGKIFWHVWKREGPPAGLPRMGPWSLSEGGTVDTN